MMYLSHVYWSTTFTIRVDEVVLHCRNIDISPFKHENFLMGAILATRPCRIVV